MSIAAHKMPPPLRDGDHLTSDEFLRRWEAMAELKHAELIDGIVYMPSPVSLPHDRFHSTLHHFLATYQDGTPGCEAGLEGTWLMEDRNVPSPDATLRILPHRGGQSRVAGNYAAGAPELVLEVAVSSRSRDLGVKLNLYERMGVREYLIAVVSESKFIWNELREGSYRRLEPDNDGIFRSQCFPGLWLDTAALWTLDRTRLFDVLRQGLATPEHAAFVARLAGSDR